MARKRQNFHCQKCNSEIQIYKKGKKHRVLVCPKCGILATNPFSFGSATEGAVVGATLGSAIPIVGTAAGAVAGGLIGGIAGGRKQKKTQETADAPRMEAHAVRQRSNSIDKIVLALGGRKYGFKG